MHQFLLKILHLRREMKNEPLQQSSSNLSHFITYFNLPRLLLNFIICTFVAATLALIFSLYMKEYVSVSSIVPSNFDAYFDLQRYTPPSLPPPPPPPLSPPPPPPPPSPPPHRVLHLDVKQAPIEQMEDEELLRRAAMQQEKNVNFPSDVIPKVAFLFLTKEELGLRLLWEKFFQGHDGLFSIYVHYSPSYNGSVPKSSVFHDRRISSKEVEWGLFSMVEAERRLLANALLDKSNERFVLLSETTIPLYNFSTIYNYLTNSRRSFLEVYDLPNAAGRGRYNPRMNPTVTIKQWRKGSQWFEINQELARLVVTDQLYFPVFAKHCQRSCYADEHYLPTFVHIVASDKNSGRTLTWADWSRHRPHPSSFNGRGVTENFLISIQNDTKCEYNGEQTNMCYLFARKFTPDALDKLLRLAPRVLGFNGS